MYAACLHCHRSLGRNALVDAFPVGERLAFDAARGRLWVVCPRCARWNLTPLEERWEAIEACERLFAGARVRSATDEIALARVRGGLSLVRVGRAERRELTAWRYGRELLRRLARTGAAATGAAAVAGAAVVSGAPLVAGLRPEVVIPFLHPVIVMAAFHLGGFGLSLRPVRIAGPGGRPYEVFRSDFDRLRLIDEPEGWGVHVKHGHGTLTLTGDDAVRALRPLMRRINGWGGLRERALDAARWIDEAGGAPAAVRRLARESAAYADGYERDRRAFESLAHVERGDWVNKPTPWNPGALHRLPAHRRLALEIAVTEDAERRAMEEELAPLTVAWREAEAIAAIADGLAVPAQVEAGVERLRGRGGDAPSTPAP